VADFLDTPAHVLRFWESRFPQIRPVKRAGGRRYYRPGDVALLAGIKKLLHDEGMTIRGVQKILREQGIRHVAGLASPDVATMLDDSDIEAVLSAEYGPRERVEEGEAFSPEALQSAQIISLETALNRQDGVRNPAPSQPELWPPAPSEDLPDTNDAEGWPGDPGEPELNKDAGSNMVSAASEVEASIAADHDVTDTDQAPDETEVTDLTAEDELPATGAEADTSTASEPVDEQEADATAVDSQSIAASAEQEAEGLTPPSTIAALLRRASPEQALTAQADLIRLRDRLIDLRGRVSEAARRRAK
jgi:DNA-binding transcriptional MerR regulator